MFRKYVGVSSAKLLKFYLVQNFIPTFIIFNSAVLGLFMFDDDFFLVLFELGWGVYHFSESISFIFAG